MSTDLLLRELGAITAKLENIEEGQSRMDGRLEKLDDRLRTVEKGAAVSGGVIAIAIGLIKGALTGGGGS